MSSTVKEDNVLFTADLTNPAIENNHCIIDKDTIHISRSRFLWRNVCYERLRFKNFHLKPVTLNIELSFESDFADIFEIRGARRRQRGKILPPKVIEERVQLSYVGRDRTVRHTTLAFNPMPDKLTPYRAEFSISLAPMEDHEILVTIATGYETTGVVFNYDGAFKDVTENVRTLKKEIVDIYTSNEQLDRKSVV